MTGKADLWNATDLVMHIPWVCVISAFSQLLLWRICTKFKIRHSDKGIQILFYELIRCYPFGLGINRIAKKSNNLPEDNENKAKHDFTAALIA